MTRNLSHQVTTVLISQIVEAKLSYEYVNRHKHPIVHIQANTPHAIVEEDGTGNQVGIIYYKKRNGLPYAEFNEPVKYMFWRDWNLTRTTLPERLN